jgi:uncharacterized protein YdbL (DUF1318 family)
MTFLVRCMLCFIISFTLTAIPVTKAHAGMISTSQIALKLDRASAEKNVTQFLSRTDVKDQLVKLGVNPEEANRRIASLSDAELKKLDQDIQKGTIGGDVTGILVVVLLVLAIIYFAKRI